MPPIEIQQAREHAGSRFLSPRITNQRWLGPAWGGRGIQYPLYKKDRNKTSTDIPPANGYKNVTAKYALPYTVCIGDVSGVLEAAFWRLLGELGTWW